MQRVLIVLSLLTLCALPGRTQGSQAPLESGDPRPADLEQLKQWVALEQGWDASRRAQALQDIAGHLEAATPFTDAEFYMEVRRIAGLADNGHSNVSTRPIGSGFGMVPVRSYWFSDGLYIVRAKQGLEQLVGARIEAIDGLPLREVEDRLMEYHGGTRGFFRRYTAPLLVQSPALLHAVGLAKSAHQVLLQVQPRTGEQVEVLLDTDRESSSISTRPWRLLNPAPLAGERGWHTVLNPDQGTALYLQEPDELIRYEPIRDGECIYIQFRTNIIRGSRSLEQLCAQLRERLEEDFPHSIIFDNRQNGGGDLTETASFGLALPSLAFESGKVYVLTDSGTFSAGIYSSFFPKAKDPERTRILGEPVGDRARFWAETGDGFRLRESGYGIGYALQLHDLAAGCVDPELCHMMRHNQAWNIAVGGLEVDVPIPTTFADYEAGRDPVLEYALAEISKQD